mmetsp:Transcript_27324/g.58022  ORF Transcript_27324/g.58022 Transcript_27324/m.58022 type:complete len:228 (+) Transcript_27324:242-925(+)
MSYHPLKTTQRLIDAQRLGDEEVCPLALEHVMLLLLHNEVDISGLHVGLLIRHSPEGYLLVVLHPFLHQYLQDLPFLLTGGYVPSPATLSTPTLQLLDHPQSDLAQFNDHTLPIASSAHFGFAHNNLSVNCYFRCLSIVEVFQADFERVVDRLRFTRTLGSATTPAAKEHGKEIIGTTSSPTILTESLKTIFVIFGAFFLVREDLIGSAYFFEFVFVATLVRMVLDG